LLLSKTKAIPDLVTAGSDKVAVRIPRHPLTLQLLASLDFPLAAPSANPFGYVSPTRAEHVDEQLGNKISYILDGGPCEVGIESTIVGFENEKVVIFRLGGVSMEDLAEVVGKDALIISNRSKNQSPDAPGMLTSHYAPGKKVIVGPLDELILQYDLTKVALISFKDYYPQIPQQRQFILSASGSLHEAAQQLFFALREMDKLSVNYILAELVPDYGLGRAINDRLLRAAE
jgi:L-threonylcarbamoyladenylate synthase